MLKPESHRETVLITGATSGIGLATARLFARNGYDCLLVARNIDKLRDLASELRRDFGADCGIVRTDVSLGQEYISILTPFIEARPPTVAVVNAGIGQYGPVWMSRWEDISKLLRTNIDGALATVHAVLPAMIERRGGSIVLISSTIGKRAIPFNAAYCASKFALQGYAESLRLEARPYDVHIGVVCPARTDTPFFENMTYSVPQKRRRQIPVSPPERVARAIAACVKYRRREVVVSMEGKLFAFVGTHFPRLMDFVLSRAVPRPEDK